MKKSLFFLPINSYANEVVLIDFFDFQIEHGRVPFFVMENPEEINCKSISHNSIRNFLKNLFNKYDITNETFEPSDL